MICVIFDMDGVLVDSYRAHFESWQRVAAEQGVAYTEKEFAWSFGRTSREIIKGTWGHPEFSDDRIRAIDARKEALFREIIGRDFPMMDGARDLIDALRHGGFRVAVGSSGPPENVRLVIEKLGGAQLFDAVVTGMDVQRGKPDPQVFLLAADRAGVPPASCVVIEDARPGIEAARRAGMASVAFVSTGRHEDDFRPVHPDLIVHSLRELDPAGLRALLNKPQMHADFRRLDRRQETD
jgi:beta-phosphoglucomutase